MEKDKFSVGQRVRIKRAYVAGLRWTPESEALIGRVGTVLRPRDQYEGMVGLRYYVDLGDCRIYPVEETLEPVYDGDQKSSWEEMEKIWQPKKVSSK